MAESTLLNCQQTASETVEKYLSRLLDQTTKLDKDADTTKKLFIHGLKPNIRSFVLSSEPGNLDDAVSKARLSESLQPAITPIIAAVLPENSIKFEQCLENIAKLLKTQNDRLETNTEEIQCIKTNMRQKININSTERQYPIVKSQCGICNRTNHTTNNCIELLHCDFCNRNGHTSNRCFLRNSRQGNNTNNRFEEFPQNNYRNNTYDRYNNTDRRNVRFERFNTDRNRSNLNFTGPPGLPERKSFGRGFPPPRRP